MTVLKVFLSGFPHSDISGSSDICSSPKLFAAYHVFHRLLVPRHPPCALISLTVCFPFPGTRRCIALHLPVTFSGCRLSDSSMNDYPLESNDSASVFLKLFLVRHGSRRNASDVLNISILDIVFNMWFSRYVLDFLMNPVLNSSGNQMEMERFELLTPCLQGRCSPN